MGSNRSASTFALVPDAWFEPVVGLWVVLLSAAGMQASLHYGAAVLGPLGAAPWAALLVTVGLSVVAYGLFGPVVVHRYRRYRGFDRRFVRRLPDASERRWLVGLPAAGVGLMLLGGTLADRSLVAAPIVGYGPPAYPDGVSALALGVPGVNGLVGQAPVVLLGMVIVGVFAGPAVAALVHGVLQEALAAVAPPAVAVGGTAALATLVSGAGAASPAAAVAFGFLLAAAVAYRATGNLLVVMGAYGLFDALALLLAWLDILASLHAHGHLFA